MVLSGYLAGAGWVLCAGGHHPDLPWVGKMMISLTKNFQSSSKIITLYSRVIIFYFGTVPPHGYQTEQIKQKIDEEFEIHHAALLSGIYILLFIAICSTDAVQKEDKDEQTAAPTPIRRFHNRHSPRNIWHSRSIISSIVWTPAPMRPTSQWTETLQTSNDAYANSIL